MKISVRPVDCASDWQRDVVMENESGVHTSSSTSSSPVWEEAIFLARETNSEELGRLLDEFRPYLLAIAKAELPRTLVAKMGPSDLIQVTLARGHAQIADFRGKSREELARWLRQILKNHLNDAVKAYGREKRDIRREVAFDSALAHPRQLSPSGAAISREELDRLSEALRRLPELYQRTIELRHQRNLSFSELGRELNRTEDAARKLWTHAIQNLQRELGLDNQPEHVAGDNKS